MTVQSSLPFGGGGSLYVAVFWVTLVLWQASESINTRFRWRSIKRSDRGSFPFWPRIGVRVLSGFASALLLSGLTMAWARTAFVAGICCVIAGAALRPIRGRDLGAVFHRVCGHPEAAQPVIDRGPYRLIRHPAYAGLLLSLTGFALALGIWLGLE